MLPRIAEDIENDKSHMPEPLFDIVAEYPEKEHVPEQMKRSAVHEHGGEYGQDRGDWLAGFETDDIVRYCTVIVNDAFTVLSGHYLHYKNQHIKTDDKDGAKRVMLIGLSSCRVSSVNSLKGLVKSGLSINSVVIPEVLNRGSIVFKRFWTPGSSQQQVSEPPDNDNINTLYKQSL